MNNITAIELKAIAKQRGIEGYYKLRKAELIHKLEAHPNVNDQVLIPGFEIQRNITRSVNASAILDQPILDDSTQYYNQHKNSLKKHVKEQRLLELVVGLETTKPKVDVEALEFFKNLIKILYNKRHTFFQLNESKSVLKNLDTESN